MRFPLAQVMGTMLSLAGWLAIASRVQAADVGDSSSLLSAVKTGNNIVVESKGGALTYKAVVDAKAGGDITQVSLPADGPVVARELNDIFYHGAHGEQYTLRGWAGKTKFVLSSSSEIVSQKPNEVVVHVSTVVTGTFHVYETNEPARATFKKTLVGYRDKTVQIERRYTFKPDRVVMEDELSWVYPGMQITRMDVASTFMRSCTQGPVQFEKNGVKKSFYLTTSAGAKIPMELTYPFTTESFLKNGYKVSLRTIEASFDLSKSTMYSYEKPWQQDWYQPSGFMYNVKGTPPNKPIRIVNEAVFAKASVDEMPPVVTIQSPAPDARWLDEDGEVAKYKIGDTVKLVVSALNPDGSVVPNKDIEWQIHIDPWWNTPAAILQGSHVSYTLPEVADGTDKAKSKDRKLLAVIYVKVKGRNGAEAVEPFAMLVGR